MDPPAHDARMPDGHLAFSRSFVSGNTTTESHKGPSRVRFDLERTSVVRSEQSHLEFPLGSKDDDTAIDDETRSSDMDEKPESKCTIVDSPPSSLESLSTDRAAKQESADTLEFKDQCRKHAAVVLSIDSPGGYKEQFRADPEEESPPLDPLIVQGEFDHTSPGQPRQAFVPVAEAQPMPSKFYPKSERKFWTVLVLTALFLNSLLVAGLTSTMFLFVAQDAGESSSDSQEESGSQGLARNDPTDSPTTSSTVAVESNAPLSSPTKISSSSPAQGPAVGPVAVPDFFIPPPPTGPTGILKSNPLYSRPLATIAPTAPIGAPSFRPTTKPSTTLIVAEEDNSSSSNTVLIGVSVSIAIVAEAVICGILYWYYKRWKLHHRSVQDSAGKSSRDDSEE